MSIKVPGLGKATGDVSFNAHLDDGDYLLEAVSAEEQKKPAQGQDPNEEDCPFQYVVRCNILAGPEQLAEGGGNPAGRPWTLFLYVDPDHEYTDLMVNRLKNALNAFGVQVRADSIKVESFAGKRAVMRIVNKIQKKGPYKGQERSDIQEFLAVEDSEYKDLK